MKLYYLLDEKFEVLKNRFVSSLKDDFELVEIKIDTPVFESTCTGELKLGGGKSIWNSKLTSIIHVLETLPENDIFIFSDVDIVFYKPVKSVISTLIKNKDILFLRERYDETVEPELGNVNFGFTIIKVNKKTHKFFCDVLKKVNEENIWDQYAVNILLYESNDHQLNWDVLSLMFFSTTIGLQHLNKYIYLYHANDTSTIEDKLKLMDRVDKVIFK